MWVGGDFLHSIRGRIQAGRGVGSPANSPERFEAAASDPGAATQQRLLERSGATGLPETGLGSACGRRDRKRQRCRLRHVNVRDGRGDPLHSYTVTVSETKNVIGLGSEIFTSFRQQSSPRRTCDLTTRAPANGATSAGEHREPHAAPLVTSNVCSAPDSDQPSPSDNRLTPFCMLASSKESPTARFLRRERATARASASRSIRRSASDDRFPALWCF